MADDVSIQFDSERDAGGLEALYRAAFPDEDLVPLLHALLPLTDDCTSLIAYDQGRVVGHAAFTFCHVGGRTRNVAVLGPLAVMPDHQRQGIGSALVEKGHADLRERGIGTVPVLGDPNYYGRFGYTKETKIAPTYALPEEWDGAWQGLRFGPDEGLQGVLGVPKPWDDPAMWR